MGELCEQADNMEGATIKEHHGMGGDVPPEYYDVTHHDIIAGIQQVLF